MTDLLDLADFAKLAGVKRQTMHTYRHRGLLPEPERLFGRNPVWRREVCEAWIAQRRKPGNPGLKPQTP